MPYIVEVKNLDDVLCEINLVHKRWSSVILGC